MYLAYDFSSICRLPETHFRLFRFSQAHLGDIWTWGMQFKNKYFAAGVVTKIPQNILLGLQESSTMLDGSDFEMGQDSNDELPQLQKTSSELVHAQKIERAKKHPQTYNYKMIGQRKHSNSGKSNPKHGYLGYLTKCCALKYHTIMQ